MRASYLTVHVLEESRPPKKNMRASIIATIRKIPNGKVSTYGAVAKAAGFPPWRPTGGCSAARRCRAPMATRARRRGSYKAARRLCLRTTLPPGVRRRDLPRPEGRHEPNTNTNSQAPILRIGRSVQPYFPEGARAYGVLSHAARIGLTATLYLIGTGISVATLKRVGHRPIASGRDSVADNFYGFLVADPRRLDCPVIPAFASPGSLS